MLRVSDAFNTVTRLKELSDNLRYLDAFPPDSKIEISSIDFVTPLAITPLAATINSKQLKYDFHGPTVDYLEVIHFPDGLGQLHIIPNIKTYIPIIHLTLQNLKSSDRSKLLNNLHSIFIDLLKNNIIADPLFLQLITNNTFGFLMGEMLDNIEEHSEAKNIYLFAQYWPKNNSCEVCLLDDGIGLFGSLSKAGRDVSNPMDALKKILDTGLSAKTEFNRVIRGTGIRNTRAALTNKEINGEYLIITGNAGFLHVASNQLIFFNLQNYSWKGTVVMMKLNKPPATFNLYNYVR